MPILTANGLFKAYGPTVLLDGVDVSIHGGERVGLVGNNGSGKSTLVRVLMGEEPADAGEVARRREATIEYLPQEPVLTAGKSAREIVLEGLRAWSGARRRYEAASAALAEGQGGSEALLEAQGEALAELERLGGWDRDREVDAMLGKVGIARVDADVAELSGGERRRVALARLLVARPDLAILDEPTNHLDVETIEWLEAHLRDDFRGAVLIITHDRYVLDRVVTRTLELDAGRVFSYQGGWSAYLEAKAERLALEARTESNRQNFLRTELEWLRRSPQARTTKQKARVDRAEAALAVRAPRVERLANLELEEVRLGKTVAELRGVSIELGGARLIEGLDLIVGRGERLGVLGPNGAGKTTLLRALLGELAPTEGEVVIGKNTQIAYFDQGRSGLDDDESVQVNVAGQRERLEVGGRTMDVRSYLSRFLFDPARARQKVAALSGGERARVALAKLLLKPANVLVLDEPTNDLDVATLGALEEMLTSMNATAIVVSHDRYFLDRVATAILAFEGEGRVVRYAGDFSTYRALRDAAARESRAEEKSRSAPPPPSSPRPRSAKLSYNERRELEALPAQIEAAEQRVATLEAELADPQVYATRGAEVPGLLAQLDAARVEVDVMMARWEELESREA